jgi:hypothetical protein
VAEAAPQMETTPPTTAGGEAAPVASAGATVGAPSVEPLEAPTAGAAVVEVPPASTTAEAPPATGAAEVPLAVDVAEAAEAGGRRPDAGAPSSGPQSLQGDEPEVVHGRHLLLSPMEVPLPRLLVKAQRLMEEAEVGFRREWEKLEAERLRLSNWERQLGNRIQVVSSRAAEERARLEQEREVLREKMGRVIDREISVISREKAVARKEKEVELKERAARHTINTAKAMAKMIDDEQATLNH